MRSLLPLAVVAALVAAGPILGNYFYADDFAHLFEIAAFGPREFITAPYAGHMYLVRNAVFYLSFLAFDMNPVGYFASALAIHVANVVLLFILLRRVTGEPLVACLASVLFAVSPASPGTLGWYSVFGHALATTAVLAALLCVTPAPGRDAPLTLRAACAGALAILVASQSFGTGAAVAVVFPLVVLLLRPGTLRAPRPLVVLAALPLIVLLAWWVMNATQSRLNPAGADAARGFALLASDYPRIAFMTAHLFVVGMQSLLLGSISSLAHYPDPESLVAVVVFVGGLLATLVSDGSRTRREILAFLLAALACYVAIAAGRGALYAAAANERLVRAIAEATRYQYLAQALLAVVLALVVADLVRRTQRQHRLVRVLVGLWLVAAVSAAGIVGLPIDHFPTDRAAVATARSRLDTAIRSVAPGATLCLPIETVPLALGFPGSAGIFVLFHPEDEVAGRRVYFVTSDPKLLALRAAGGRMGRLLAPPGACPPSPDGAAS